MLWTHLKSTLLGRKNKVISLSIDRMISRLHLVGPSGFKKQDVFGASSSLSKRMTEVIFIEN